MKSDSFFGYFGHGDKGCLEFFNNDWNVLGAVNSSCITGSETGSYKYALSELPYNQLSNLKMLLTTSCLTGQNSTASANFIGTAYDRGAHFVTGNTLEVYYGGNPNYADYWRLTVMMNLAVGNTIYEGLIAADEYLYNSAGVTCNHECRHTLGDNSIRLYFELANNNSSANIAIANGNTRMSLLTTQTIDGTTSHYYKDDNNNLYGYDNVNQQLNYYIASVNDDEYGNHVVEQATALACATDFLEKHNISVNDYSIEHSNSHAKDFRIVYENDTNRMALKLQANNAGDVIVTNFFIYKKEVSQ